MRVLLVLLAGGLVLGAWWRRRTRRGRPELGPSPAEELRAKLAETRAAGEPAPPPTPPPPPPAPDPDARRREVHERARRKLDELG